jgi:hypothetical protein
VIKMLDEFLETNDLKSMVMTLPTDTKMNYAISKNLFPKKFAVDVELFILENGEAVIVVIPFNSEIDFEKLKEVLNEDEFLVANNKESMEITGYRKNFIPLLSVYGIKYYIDSSLEKNDLLICRVNEKQFLKADISEIEEYNEVEFVSLIKE